MIKKKSQKPAQLFATMLFLIMVAALVSATRVPAAESILNVNKKWSGDFNAMAKKNYIRALVPYSKTFYFLDGAHQRGLTYELLKEFEKYINIKLKRKTIEVRIIIIPTPRDRLLPALVDGLGDIAAGNLTITQQRLKKMILRHRILLKSMKLL